MLVPLNDDHSPTRGGTDDRIETPGALTSGFMASETGVGPAEENGAMMSLFVTAAAVIAPEALPGDETDPPPKSSNSLPAAIVGTTPAFAAPFSAATTMSREASISGSPSERLTTSMPSATAASIAAAISGALPSSPNWSVGTVSAL